MQKTKWIALSLMLVLSTSACAGNPGDALLKSILDLNSQTAVSIAKADDLASFDAVMKQYDEKFQDVIAAVKKLEPEARKEFIAKADKALEKSMADFEASIDGFHAKIIKAGPHPTVVMETSMGTIKIELYEKLSPITVKNFLSYVEKKHFDGLIFHRVIADFMIQGGGFAPGMKRELPTGQGIKNEAHNRFPNKRGTIAMARTGDPHSATAQFFINTKDNKALNKIGSRDGWGYAAFGRVTEGMDVVDKIRLVKTGEVAGHDDVPLQDVIIKSVRLQK
jgi:peptidyl-prolyl cis-trans isomerase B (cyclophilin B)